MTIENLNSRVIEAVSRYLCAETGMEVKDAREDMLDGDIGIVMERENTLRFCAVRVRMADTDDFDAFPAILRPTVLRWEKAIWRYVIDNGIDMETTNCHLDVVDLGVVAGSQAALRRVTDVDLEIEVDDVLDGLEDFERNMFADIHARINAGEDVPIGRIEEVDGKPHFVGSAA